MLSPLAPSASDLSRALGLSHDAPSRLLPKPGTRPWYAALVAFDLADTLRSVRLPCAARLCRSDAPADDWRDITTELESATVSELRVHEVRAAAKAARFMSTAEPIGAADVLQKCRGCDTLTEWSDKVRVEMLKAGVRL
jgi:hypothetical protein